MTKNDLKKINFLSQSIDSLEKLISGPLMVSRDNERISLDINEPEMLREVQEVLRAHLKAKKEEFERIKID